MKKLSLITVISVVAVSSVAFAVDWKKHPHLHKAHTQVENAKTSLKEANDHEKSEFGGHRAKAIELLNQAQAEIEASVDWADSHK